MKYVYINLELGTKDTSDICKSLNDDPKSFHELSKGLKIGADILKLKLELLRKGGFISLVPVITPEESDDYYVRHLMSKGYTKEDAECLAAGKEI